MIRNPEPTEQQFIVAARTVAPHKERNGEREKKKHANNGRGVVSAMSLQFDSTLLGDACTLAAILFLFPELFYCRKPCRF